MLGKCWKCEKMNQIEHDGYCFCRGCNLWYAPMKKKQTVQRFLDDEEMTG